jgi:hypothetical protein
MNHYRLSVFLLLSVSLLLVRSASAAGPDKAAKEKAPERSNVLNFDADVIQGERKRPDLFIQLGGATTNMEAVLYGRQNFNDFHAVDQVLRPSFYEVPRGTKPKPIPPRTSK